MRIKSPDESSRKLYAGLVQKKTDSLSEPLPYLMLSLEVEINSSVKYIL